jgi:hypothetical protein
MLWDAGAIEELASETAEELNCKIGLLGLVGRLGALYECGGELSGNFDDIYTEFT